MSDIALSFQELSFDISLEDGDIAGDDGLETAVTISVFTDKRVTEDDLPDLETDKRGYWGDMFPDVPGDKAGSRLWTMNRSKVSQETLSRSEELISESLEWMLEDGVASNISVTSSYGESNILISDIEIEKPDGNSTRYQINWEGQRIRRM